MYNHKLLVKFHSNVANTKHQTKHVGYVYYQTTTFQVWMITARM